MDSPIIINLDESTFNFRGVRSDYHFLFHFSMKLLLANRIAQMGCRVLQRRIWGYTVCLCPIKRMQGLYNLNYSNDPKFQTDLYKVLVKVFNDYFIDCIPF